MNDELVIQLLLCILLCFAFFFYNAGNAVLCSFFVLLMLPAFFLLNKLL